MANSNNNRYYLLASAVAAFVAMGLWNHDMASTEAEDSEHDHEEFVALTPEQCNAAGIRTHAVSSGFLQSSIRTNGKIVLNNNHVAHVIPKLPGIVATVNKNEGEEVEEGDVLVVLESRETAEAKSTYLGALRKIKTSSNLLLMEQELHSKQLTSTQDFQGALKEFNSAETELELARQQLYALGVDREELDSMENGDIAQLRFYAVKAPLAGTILHRHATLGELLSPEKAAFTIADLDHLWVEVSIYPQDQPLVKKGAQIRIQALDGQQGSAEIVYVSPVIDEETRKAKAVALIDNTARTWNPGSYVAIEIDTDKQPVPLVINKEAIQTIEGSSCVFVEADNGFEIRPIEAGRCDGKRTEILAGISKGERVATTNTFLLKADHLKNEAEHEH